MAPDNFKLSRQDIVEALQRIDELCRSSGVIVELSIYGGAAMVLAFDAREATRDLDAVVRGSPQRLREISAAVAEERGWPQDWLNDGVKGFLSAQEDLRELPDLFPGTPGMGSTDSSGLRVFVPSPQYLLAMKCMAMRLEAVDGDGVPQDRQDITLLLQLCEMEDPEEVMQLVESFYPPSRIPPRVQYGIEDILQSMTQTKDDEPTNTPARDTGG